MRERRDDPPNAYAHAPDADLAAAGAALDAGRVQEARELANAVAIRSQGNSTLNEARALAFMAHCDRVGSRLRRAAESLQHADATLVPTADGGYVLLGLNRFHASLFDDIEWSTDGVAAETRRRLARLGWRVQDEPTVHDIDEPADLRWLPREWPESAREPADAA